MMPRARLQQSRLGRFLAHDSYIRLVIYFEIRRVNYKSQLHEHRKFTEVMKAESGSRAKLLVKSQWDTKQR